MTSISRSQEPELVTE